MTLDIGIPLENILKASVTEDGIRKTTEALIIFLGEVEQAHYNYLESRLTEFFGGNKVP